MLPPSNVLVLLLPVSPNPSLTHFKFQPRDKFTPSSTLAYDRVGQNEGDDQVMLLFHCGIKYAHHNHNTILFCLRSVAFCHRLFEHLNCQKCQFRSIKAMIHPVLNSFTLLPTLLSLNVELTIIIGQLNLRMTAIFYQ